MSQRAGFGLPTTKASNRPASNPGHQQNAVVEHGEGTISVVLNNSAGTNPKTYVLGDAFGLYASNANATLANPDSGSSNPAIMKTSFGSQPVTVKQIEIAVSQSGNQFANPIRKIEAFRTGDVESKKINTNLGKSKFQTDNKVQVLNFQDGELVLSGTKGFIWTLNPGETATLEIVVGNYVG